MLSHATTQLEYDGGEAGYATGKWEAERLTVLAHRQRPALVVRPFNSNADLARLYRRIRRFF